MLLGANRTYEWPAQIIVVELQQVSNEEMQLLPWKEHIKCSLQYARVGGNELNPQIVA